MCEEGIEHLTPNSCKRCLDLESFKELKIWLIE